MIMRIASLGVLAGILVPSPLLAQTAPCGRTLLLANQESGSPLESRFIPAPPEHVEASALRALPAVGAVLVRKDGLVLMAKSDGGKFEMRRDFGLWGAWYNANKEAGVRGNTAGTTKGEWTLELRPETRDGVVGTNLKIGFKRGTGSTYGKNGATPLMDEIECLSGLLTSEDPLSNPSGPGPSVAFTDGRTVTLADGTPVQLTLRDPWFSKDAAKSAGQAKVVFEVAAGIVVEGATLVRKGALAVGRFTEVKAAGGGGSGARMQFAIDYITAVDSQSVPVTGAKQDLKGMGVRIKDHVGPALWWIQKGFDTLLRAGTAFEVEVSGTHLIKVAQ